jgi:hypothetical protein
MKITRCFLGVVLFTWASCSLAEGQTPMYRPAYPPPLPITENGRRDEGKEVPLSPGGVLSDWILYRGDAPAVNRQWTDGPPGPITPLYTELYLRAGPSVPLSSTTLGRQLEVGWSIIGGGRALFFNQPMTKAWTVDAHIINTNEGGATPTESFPVTVFSAGAKLVSGVNGFPNVTVQASNRTMVGLGVGREWYLWPAANAHGAQWRVGADIGGRWGSHNLQLNETRHLTDIITGFYVGVHSDVEIPCHYGIFFTGLRFEWAQTYSQALQQNSDVQDLNILLTVGLRF